ncbi:restriction endonuclease subunit S [Opitutales bacterium ASA1]|uniref:restriction endonuclease subunit S n=1 Tax=Congregicoccus parvus TaxID=3081749 RepID=UPI002B293CE2|nr:restriction endonuclease subunit S [Opitutales bacterium ASA1]
MRTLAASREFKDTPAGTIPVDWRCARLSEVCRTFSGGTPSRKHAANFGGGIPWIKSGELNSRLIESTEETISKVSLANSAAKIVEAGTCLVALYGATAGVVGRSMIEAAINQAILAIVPRTDELLDSFLFVALEHVVPQAVRLVQGGQPNLNAGIIESLYLPIPPRREQQRIVDTLHQWDDSISLSDRLVTAKIDYERGSLSELVNGRWSLVRLGDVAQECFDRNGSTYPRERLSAVTKKDGIVPMRERVQGDDISRCKIVEPGWFAYNPMRLNIGSIARLERESAAIVSGDYVVFRALEDRLLGDYLDHLRRSDRWANFVRRSGNGSVRVRIWFPDLGRFQFPLPPLKQQRRVADLLSSMTREISMLQEKSEALREEKRGLMQKLFSGKVRLKDGS